MSADDLALYRRMTVLYLDHERIGNETEAEDILNQLDLIWLRLTDEERHELSREEGTQA